MRAATGSQWSSMSSGVTCALFGWLNTRRAAAFWIICSGFTTLLLSLSLSHLVFPSSSFSLSAQSSHLNVSVPSLSVSICLFNSPSLASIVLFHSSVLCCPCSLSLHPSLPLISHCPSFMDAPLSLPFSLSLCRSFYLINTKQCLHSGLKCCFL